VLSTILATIVVLGVLILVHELGHFLAAKSVDIEVPRFSLGLGPRVWGFRIGETEYVLSAIPLGGYVKMAGMEDEEATAALEGGMDVPEEPRGPGPRDFESKPLWARIWVISAGVLMNFLFAFVVYAGIFLAYGERFDPTTRVGVVNGEALTGAAAQLARLPEGARLAAVGDRPVEKWRDIGEALQEAPAGPVTLRFADAPDVTLRLPATAGERAEMIGALRPLYEPVIGEVAPGTPAERAGLRPGDRVLEAAGEPVRSWQDFVRAVETHPARRLDLVVERAGERVALSATPAVELFDRELQRDSIGKLGVGVQLDLISRPLGTFEAVGRGAEVTWLNTRMIVTFLGQLIGGDESPRSVGSILTIGQVSGRAARMGLEPFFVFMALLSINLAIVNLLPIPILDGGHLLFLGIEAIRGRPLSVEQRIRLSHVGLIIIVGIMVWAMTNDVLRIFGI
jgi:regulator of sigma E protease